MKKIAFLGAGNMAFALASAFYVEDSSLLFSLCDPSEERQQLFLSHFPSCEIFFSPLSMAKEADLLILAVKPQVLPSVIPSLAALGKEVNPPVVLSIVAGISLAKLSLWLPHVVSVRLMPNTPCLVGEMAGGIVFPDSLPTEKKSSLLSLLRRAGEVIEVKESQMDAVTALSGSGPAFVARLIESFIEAGKKMGLEESAASLLTLATFSGTANLLKGKNLSPEALVKMVSSPNGTTVAGREALESSDYQKIIEKTVAAAKNRSIELGKENG